MTTMTRTPAGTSTAPAPTTSPAAPVERRRTLSGIRRSDVLALLGSALGSGGATWLLFTQLAPFSGILGWLVVWYVLFIGLYALVVWFDESGQAVIDRVAAAVIQSLAVILLFALAAVVTYAVGRGLPAMSHFNLYTQDLARTGPLQPLSSGGVLHGIVGTLEEITIALVLTIPTGLLCAVFLKEFPGPFARLVRTVVEAMTALPSIVAGLFVYSTWILVLGFPRSGLAAGIALGVMALPIIIRAADVVLRLVPGSLTEASLALGASRWRTVWYVTLPTARSGLATAVILGTARAIGETSPVLLTAGYGNATNLNPFSGPMVSLPLLAYELRRFPEAGMISRAFGAASILLVIVVLLFVVARSLGGRGAGNLTPRQLRRRTRQSLDDAQRLAARAHSRRQAQEAADAVQPDVPPVVPPVDDVPPDDDVQPDPTPTPTHDPGSDPT